jgi:gamma-glutamylcyclotransferase (GGCT)/AIG2-like uncharacterized protein YtfP
MCIIIHNPRGNKIKDKIIEFSIWDNDHGIGFYDIKNDKLVKSMDMKIAEQLMSQSIPYVAHCRLATLGEKTIDNVHGFELGDWLVFMNGTIKGLAEKDKNDTKQMVELLKYIKPEHVANFLSGFEARFLLINRVTKAVIRTGKWKKHKGCFYSKETVLREHKFRNYGYSGTYIGGYSAGNTNHNDPVPDYQNQKKIGSGSPLQKRVVEKNHSPFPMESTDKFNPRVAVYCELKKGFKHHDEYLKNSQFLGYGRTQTKYRLCVDGLPYMITPANGQGGQIEVEIYSVTPEVMKRLELLHGIDHKNTAMFEKYHAEFKLELDAETEKTIWAYIFACPIDNIADTGEYISSYQKDFVLTG